MHTVKMFLYIYVSKVTQWYMSCINCSWFYQCRGDQAGCLLADQTGELWNWCKQWGFAGSYTPRRQTTHDKLRCTDQETAKPQTSAQNICFRNWTPAAELRVNGYRWAGYSTCRLQSPDAVMLNIREACSIERWTLQLCWPSARDSCSTVDICTVCRGCAPEKKTHF